MGVYQDLSGRSASMRALIVRGLAVITALIIAGTFLYRATRGTVESPFTLTVLTDSIGEGVLPGAEVKYHGYTIGAVQTLEPTSSGKQRMTLVLEGRQAVVLTTDTRAKFIPSNSFGPVSVELASGGQGAQLVSGSTLRIGKDSNSASLTALLRRSGELQRVLDQSDIGQAAAIFGKHLDLVSPVSQALFDTAKIITILGRGEKLSQSLAVIASVLNGLNHLLPLAPAANHVAQGLEWLLAPGAKEGFATKLFDPLAGLFVEGNDVISSNQDWLVPLLRGLMNILSPASYALGSIAPEYGRLPGLIDKTGALFAVANGGKAVKLDLSVDVVPGLQNALQTEQPAPQSAEQPPSSGTGEHPEPEESDSDGDEHEQGH